MIRHYDAHDSLTAALVRSEGLRLPSPPVKTYSKGIDWVAVERAARGELRADALTPAELREACNWLTAAGMSRAAISTQLSVYERLVKEWAAEAGLLPEKDLCTAGTCRKAASGRQLCTLHLSQHRAAEKRAAAQMAVAA
ncbi:hypothetical protein AB0D97_12770 [Streptomyces roseus]|uniref:hypothetical protein n=1 Tax=Streptomyces roseus TaxID=66430 RepID=UPI0033D5EC18